MDKDQIRQEAKEAVLYTNRALSLGPANGAVNRAIDLVVSTISLGNAEGTAQIRARGMRELFKDKFKEKVVSTDGKSSCFVLSFPMFAEIEKGAKTAKTGCCGEFAIVAFQYLYNIHRLGERENPPLELIGAPGHWMVLINRNKETKLTDPSTWNEDSVICDAWNEDIWNGRDYNRCWKKNPTHSMRLPDDLHTGKLGVGDWYSW